MRPSIPAFLMRTALAFFLAHAPFPLQVVLIQSGVSSFSNNSYEIEAEKR
jgi:hypothetical protein